MAKASRQARKQRKKEILSEAAQLAKQATHCGYFDGGCFPKNPGGTGTYGATLLTNTGEKLFERHGAIGSGPEMTNNCAEYAGLEALFVGVVVSSVPPGSIVLVRGDSSLVINQMLGLWKVKNGHYKPWYKSACMARDVVVDMGIIVTYEWVPRSLNSRADALTIQARAAC